MGFFSWNCKVCGHPALCPQATDPEINRWMSQVVVTFPNGDRISGEYDGYGRVGRGEIDYGSKACVLHKACWVTSGKPEYLGPSDDAEDQGWFFDDGDHDMMEPGTVPESETAAAVALAAAKRDGRKRGLRFRDKDEDADEGTYQEMFRMVCEDARKLPTKDARVSKYGYDPLEYA